jgi:Cu2+-exporting ATPase
MILEMLVLGGILSIGIKELKKVRQIKKSSVPSQSKTTESITQDIKQLAEESSKQKRLQKSNNGHQKQNMRASAASLLALTFSITGFFYWPFGLLSIPFLIYAIQESLEQSYQLIKQGQVNVNTLLSITMIGCIILGRFFIANLIIVLYLWALRFTAKLFQNSQQQLADVFEQYPTTVWIIVEGVEVKLPFNQLQVGDVVVVQAGEIIPADGIVIEGMASVDQHILTGEARPIERGTGEEVFASTVVLSGKIHLKVEKAGEESTVAKITHILNQTIDFKSTTQLRAEMFSEQLVKPALIAGGVALPILGFNGALAVVNAHPKNKIMLVAPMTILNYLKLASKQGILIKDGRSLELLNQVDTIVFDKTGTLTEEQPHVGTIHGCSSFSDNEILTYAAAAESKQTHPLAQAIRQAAENRQLELPSIDESEYQVGYGLTVSIDGQTVHVGSERFMEALNMAIPVSLKHQQQLGHEQGYTLVMVAVNNCIIGAIELLPTVRKEAKAIISRLKQRPQIKATYIISGDNEIPTRKLAQELGIDHYFAETLPEKKADIIEQLQQQGHFICYIGDGINDSIALKKSQVSISLRGASTIATDTAQIVLMDEGLNHLDFLFDLANKFNTNMNRSFALLLTPAVIGVSGAFLLGFGVSQTIALNIIGLFLGIGNAMTPLLKPPAK